MSLNIDKSNLLLYDLGKQDKSPFKVSIDGQVLTPQPFPKYLGVYIDDKLSWNKHIEMVVRKINQGLEIIRKLRDFLQEQQLKSPFNSFIKSFTGYGNIIWGMLK